MPKEKEILSPIQSIGVGAAAGVGQTFFSLPAWNTKVRQQCGYPFVFSPDVLYKGVVPACLSISMMSVSQVAFTTLAHRLIHKDNVDSQETHGERVVSAFAGGALATMIANPVGVIITQQHKYADKSFLSAGKYLLNTQGPRSLYISFAGNWAINSLFTLSFYAAYPYVNQKITPYVKNDFLATSTSNMIVGLGTTLFTQPIDTLKTRQEENADQPKKSLKKYIELVKKSPSRFYAGFWPALASQTAAIAVAGIMVEKAEDYFSNRK